MQFKVPGGDASSRWIRGRTEDILIRWWVAAQRVGGGPSVSVALMPGRTLGHPHMLARWLQGIPLPPRDVELVVPEDETLLRSRFNSILRNKLGDRVRSYDLAAAASPVHLLSSVSAAARGYLLITLLENSIVGPDFLQVHLRCQLARPCAVMGVRYAGLLREAKPAAARAKASVKPRAADKSSAARFSVATEAADAAFETSEMVFQEADSQLSPADFNWLLVSEVDMDPGRTFAEVRRNSSQHPAPWIHASFGNLSLPRDRLTAVIQQISRDAAPTATKSPVQQLWESGLPFVFEPRAQAIGIHD